MIRDVLNKLGLLWLRILTGCGIAWHGYQKIVGGSMDRFSAGVAGMGFPFPDVFAWLAALSEFAGGIFIALGFATRLAALAVFLTMSVAAFIRHADDPFSVKELALAYWTMAGAIMLTGAGPFSLDALICRNDRTKKKRLDPL